MNENIKLEMNDFLPLRDVVFQTLRQAILRGQLQPGERLMEIHLANQLGVSRTPVREALRKLELEGLVVTIPRKGAIVANIAPSDLQDVLEVREALEELAVRKACENITDEQIEKLHEAGRVFEECINNGDIIKCAQADVDFHEVITEATLNRRLIQLLNNLRGQMYRYRLENLKNVNTHKELLRQHQRICDAVQKRDAEAAAEAIREHIRKQKDAIIENLHRERG